MKPATCHPDRPHLAKGLCRTCYNREWNANTPDYAERHRQYQRTHVEKKTGRPVTPRGPNDGKGSTPAMRVRVLEQYGSVCCGCGFTDVRALQLDHKLGGGTEEKSRLGYRGVLKRALEIPEEYQILCANCNWIKRVEKREHL